MSSARRHDLAEEGRTITDDTRVFKKPFQTVDRPQVTDHNINDEYMRNPPQVLYISSYKEKDCAKSTLAQNLPIETEKAPTQPTRGVRGAKEGAYGDIDPKEDGVLGDLPVGKRTKESALEEIVTEASVHPRR